MKLKERMIGIVRVTITGYRSIDEILRAEMFLINRTRFLIVNSKRDIMVGLFSSLSQEKIAGRDDNIVPSQMAICDS
jgi:hypothetical protein